MKQLGSFSYEELAFHLADSASYRAFCRIGSMEKLPTSKTLQRNVKKVEAITLERINVLLVEHAIAAEVEEKRPASLRAAFGFLVEIRGIEPLTS